MDAPLTTGMTRTDMAETLKKRHDRTDEMIEKSLDLAAAKGTSLQDSNLSVIDIISTNRAGPAEEHIDPNTLIDLLFRQRVDLETIR